MARLFRSNPTEEARAKSAQPSPQGQQSRDHDGQADVMQSNLSADLPAFQPLQQPDQTSDHASTADVIVDAPIIAS